MMRVRSPWTLALLLLTELASACGAESEPPPLTRATLSEIQREVFDVSCAFSTCHRGASPAGGLGLDSDAYERLVNVPSVEAPDRVRVKPGEPSASYIMDKLTNQMPPEAALSGVQWTPMPPTGPLEPERIERVRLWILNGAPND